MIRIVGRGYFDWNYSIVHRRSPAPRRELPREPVPVPTSDLRPAGCSRLQLSGRAELIRIKLPICLCMRMRYPRGERAATAQQLTGRTGSDRAANLPRQYRKRTATARQTRSNRAATAPAYTCRYIVYVSNTARAYAIWIALYLVHMLVHM